MLKSKFKIFLAIILLIIVAFSTLCFADDEETNKVVMPENASNTTDVPTVVSTNTSGSFKQGDQYLVNFSVNVDYDIEGNVYILAESATVSSNIMGNVFICAKNVTISNTASVSNSLYIAAENITMNGTASDLYMAANSMIFTGNISRATHLAANSIDFSGNVAKDAAIAFKEVNFSSTATISGNLDYSSENEASIPSGVVSGTIKFTKAENININFAGLNFVFNPIFRLACFVIACLLLGLIFKKFTPNFFDNSSKLISDSPFKTFFTGLLGFICIPLISVFLMLTMVAFILGISLILLYVVFALVSSFVFVITINELIAKKLNFDKKSKVILLLIATSAVAWSLTLIPFVGGIFGIVYGTSGFGIIVRNILSKKNKEEVIKE